MTNFETLISIRKALGWTQEQMAGALNLDRSYLSLLESGKRPVSAGIISRAEAIMHEAQRLAPPVDLGNLEEQVGSMPAEALVSAYEYIVERRNSAPVYVQVFYRFISTILMRELTRRMGLSIDAEKRKGRKP